MIDRRRLLQLAAGVPVASVGLPARNVGQEAKRLAPHGDVSCHIITRYNEWFVLTKWPPRHDGTHVQVWGRCYGGTEVLEPIQEWVGLGFADAAAGELLSGPFSGDPPDGVEIAVGEVTDSIRGIHWKLARYSNC